MEKENINLQRLIDSKYKKLTLEEQKLIHHLYHQKDDTLKYTKEQLKSIVFRLDPPSPEDFLDPKNEWITKEFKDSLYTHVIDDFIEIMNYNKKYTEVCEYGAIRLGKTYLARMMIMYTIIFIHCLRHPQLYYKLAPTTLLSIYIMCFKVEKIKQLILKPLLNFLGASPRFKKVKFQDKVKEEQYKNGLDIIYWSTAATFGEITLDSDLTINMGTDFGDLLGSDLLMLIVSEIAFFVDKTGATHDEIFQIYKDGRRRIKSTVGNNYLGLVYLDTSANDKDNPIEKYILDVLAKNKDAFFRKRNQWEARPYLFEKWQETGETFKFFIGNNIYPPKIIETKQDLTDLPENHIIDIPIDVKKDFEEDPIKSTKDIAGLPTIKETKLITNFNLILDIFSEKTLKNIEGILYTESYDEPENLIWEIIKDVFFIKTLAGKYKIYRAPQEIRFVGIDLAHCVDSDTEILTQRGWLNYNELKIGDKTLGLDETLTKAKWTTITNINIFEKKERKMLEIKSKTHSSLSTLNHRWIVDERKWNSKEKKYSGYERKVITSDKLSTRHKIIRNVEIIDLPSKSIYSNSFVELVAWFWTEGTIYKNKDGAQSNYINICQSEKVNSKYCKRISKILTKEYGEPVKLFERNGTCFPNKPQWRTRMHKNKEKRDWYLNSYIGKKLTDVAPNKIVTYGFILSLTKYQLELFVKTSFDADRNNKNSLGQKNKNKLKGLELALILLGNAVNFRSTSGLSYISKIKSPRIKLYKKKMKKVIYNDTVWCPTTETGTWFARRNGKTYYTGNSLTGDVQGITLGHKEWSNDLNTVVYVSDFSFAIGAKESAINLEAVSYFIKDLVVYGNIAIKQVFCDSFQSQFLLQFLNRNNIESIKQSVDKEVNPYQFLLKCMFNSTIKCGKNIFLKNNLDSLITIKTKNDKEKIDHTKGKTNNIYDGRWNDSNCGINAKDVSDSLCQFVWGAQNYNYVPETIFEEENEKLSNKVLDTEKQINIAWKDLHVYY